MSNTTRRPRVYLVGVAGNPNLGDELIVEAWLRYLDTHLPDADVWLDTPFPGPATALLAPRHPRIHVTDTLFRLRDRALEDGADDVGEFVIKALDDPGNTPWWTAGIDVLKGADVIHLVGGGYANDLWRENLALFDALGWLAQHTGARVGVTGQGLLPLGDASAARVAGAAHHLGLLDVRDAGSARALTIRGCPLLPLRLTGDDILLCPPRLDVAAAERFDVGIVVQDDLRTVEWANLVGFVKRQIDHWGADPDRVAVIECIPRIDARIHTELARRLPELQFYSFQHVWQHGFPAAPHQRWISTRYHPHLLAAMAGASGVAISVRPDYYDAKHDLVRQAGSGWPLVSDLSTPVTELGVVHLPDRLPAMVHRKQETARVLYKDNVQASVAHACRRWVLANREK